MPAKRPSRSTQAALEATSVEEAKAAAGAGPGGPGSGEPLLGELRKAGVLPLLVLHFVREGPSYGNQLMERIQQLSAGTLPVNPNTMYPLLRSLEARELLQGEWEHPERRSRRFYRITPAGQQEHDRLLRDIAPRLDALATGIQLIRGELLGEDEG